MTNHELEPNTNTPEAGPNLELVSSEGPAGPFFDADGHHISEYAVDDLNVEQFKHGPLDKEDFDLELVTRFAIEATFGSIHEDKFKEDYEKSWGVLLQALTDEDKQAELTEQVTAMYPYLEDHAPRLLHVIDKFREKQIASGPELNKVLRLSFLVATQYT